MYESFYGLRERPFELTPNPRFLFMTSRHREALTTLEYGLTARTGIALLVGEAGTGKTTHRACGAAVADSVRQSLAVYLNNPSLTRDEFIEFLAAGFGLSAEAARSKTRCLSELTEVLAARHSPGDDVRAHHRRSAVPARRAARRSAAARQHRVGVREAAVDHPGRPARAGRCA